MTTIPEIFVGQTFKTRLDHREIVGVLRNSIGEATILWKSIKRGRTDWGVAMLSVILDWIKADQAGKPADG